MRVFVSIFLFLLFLTQTFSSFVFDGMYCLNRNYVAQTLCENKARPQMHCNGKCYLSKQIEKDSKENTLPPGNKKESGNDVYLFPAEIPALPVVGILNQNLYPHFTSYFLSYRHHSLLRPPQVLFV